MNSYSIETQQNANSQPENSKIAEIYQRMLMGEKSALASLQKIKIHTPKQTIQYNQLLSDEEELPEFTHKKSMSKTDLQNRSQNNHYSVKQSPFDRVKTIHEQPLEESMLKQKQKDKQQEKLRSYIKKKVNELRSQKELFRNQEEKEIIQIKKTNDTRKTHTVNQSKSYDLVRKKDFAHKTANQTKTGMTAVKQQVKKAFENISIQQGMSKIQSSSKANNNKQLPPLRKKLPTEHSENNKNHQLAQSKVISRKDIRTPINLADSSLKVQLKSIESQEQKNKGSPSKSVKNEGSPNKKPEHSRMKKISLPELRRMREEFGVLNQRQRAIQLEMMEYHMMTKKQVQQIRLKNQLNFRNEDKLKQLRRGLNPEPVSTLKNNNSGVGLMKQENSLQQGKKKKVYVVQQEKIQRNMIDIKLIDEAIAKKGQKVAKIHESLQKNLLAKYWQSKNLYTQNFQSQQQDIVDLMQPSRVQQPRTQNERHGYQAYSTGMPQTRDKRWKRKVIKEYDTNRSLQEYSKSRSQFRGNGDGNNNNNGHNPNRQSGQQQDNSNSNSNNHNKKQRLKRIDEKDDDEQDNGMNRVIVNSRLKKLLLLQ